MQYGPQWGPPVVTRIYIGQLCKSFTVSCWFLLQCLNVVFCVNVANTILFAPFHCFNHNNHNHNTATTTSDNNGNDNDGNDDNGNDDNGNDNDGNNNDGNNRKNIVAVMLCYHKNQTTKRDKLIFSISFLAPAHMRHLLWGDHEHTTMYSMARRTISLDRSARAVVNEDDLAALVLRGNDRSRVGDDQFDPEIEGPI